MNATADTNTAKAGQKPKAGQAASAGTDRPNARNRPPVFVSRDRMQVVEQMQVDWRVTVPPGTTAEDLHLRQEPWSAVADLASIGDRLTIVTADDKTLMYGVCVYGRRGVGSAALVHITDVFELPNINDEKGAPPGYGIRQSTLEELPVHGSWVAYRESDGHIMNYGNPLYSRDEARVYLNNHAAVRDMDKHPAHKHTMS